jgi:carbonyl reductase 1
LTDLKGNQFSISNELDPSGLKILVSYFSAAGCLGLIPSADLRAKFASSDSTLSIEDLSGLMNDFIAAAEAGNHADLGWPNSTYVVSKVGLSALSRIQQREFNHDSRKVKS